MPTTEGASSPPDKPGVDTPVDPGPFEADVEERGDYDEELGWPSQGDAEDADDPGQLPAERMPTEQ
jgi:hypothetical protein